MFNQYVYKPSEPGLFTVGYYDPSGMWMPESDHPTKEIAAERVSYLNGNCMAQHGQPVCYPINEHLMRQIYLALYNRQERNNGSMSGGVPKADYEVTYCLGAIDHILPDLKGDWIEPVQKPIDTRSLGDNTDDKQA